MDVSTLPPVVLAPLPVPLHWLGSPTSWATGNRTLTIGAGPTTDLFVDPGGGDAILNAPRLVGAVEGAWLLSARVSVEFAATFDAGVLVLYTGERTWAKLCLEYSPEHRPMVVSVVTRGVSDDSNSFVVNGSAAWLRIARLGRSYGFHASLDGATWQLVRHFALDSDPPPDVGFLAQSPSGEGCVVSFEDIRFEARRLADIRDGT